MFWHILCVNAQRPRTSSVTTENSLRFLDKCHLHLILDLLISTGLCAGDLKMEQKYLSNLENISSKTPSILIPFLFENGDIFMRFNLLSTLGHRPHLCVLETLRFCWNENAIVAPRFRSLFLTVRANAPPLKIPKTNSFLARTK